MNPTSSEEMELEQVKPGDTPIRDSRAAAIARASLGAILLAVALGVATTAGEAVRIELDWPRWAVNSVLAAIVFLMVVPGIWWLQTRVCGEPISLLGLSGIRKTLSAGGMGFGLTVGWGLILLLACSMLGWFEVGPVDISEFLVWLPGTLGFVLLYEALPEEVSLRGFALTHLNRSMQLRWAVLVGMVLFGAVPIGANMIRWLLISLSGLEDAAFSLAPEGESAVNYFSMLLGFGFALSVARLATGSLGTAIGLHLGFITFNRLMLSNEESGTGVTFEMAASVPALLLPAYLSLTIVTLFWLASRRGSPIDWKHVSR